VMTVVAAALTSFYSWRLIFKTFHGHPHDHHHHEHAHESPIVMLIPLAVLAIGSFAAGYPFKDLFAGHGVEHFFRGSLGIGEANTILDDMHHVPAAVVYTPTVMMVLGFLVAYLFYIRRPDIPVSLAREHDVLYRFLLNKWYFDELYDAIFVRPAKWIGRVFWKGGDGWLIDGFGPDGVSARVLDVTRSVVRLQTGYLYHYAFAMLIGVALLITWFMFAGAH
jgi:NADH-quinone oxidoreductase subunit L